MKVGAFLLLLAPLYPTIAPACLIIGPLLPAKGVAMRVKIEASQIVGNSVFPTTKSFQKITGKRT